MKRYLLAAVVAFALLSGSVLAFQPAPPQRPPARRDSAQARVYYPPRGGNWQRRRPEQVGINAARLEEAIAYARAQESRVPRDFSTQVETFGALLGPIPRERGGTNGLILRHGYIVAEWGDTSRVEPVYSVAKSFLSTTLGLALDRGLIRDVHDPVRLYVRDGGYDSPHNARITWHHHAQQTSEWEGEMWGKRHDFIGAEEFGRGRREPRELRAPGTYYEYNDVRINRFALSLLRVWQKLLPEVLRDEVMNPIGASNTWQYHGYRNSDVNINGRRMASVSGGTRWGGGLWMNTRDAARFGYLFLRRGRWQNRQIISERWIRMATTRGEVGPDYGYLWWLNTERRQWPSAPATSYAALGYGSNIIWIDPEHDLIIVWRWYHGNPDELIRRVLAAVEQ